MMIYRVGSIALTGILLSCLAGCSDGGLQDLKDWMKEVKSHTKANIPKVAEPKEFVPFSYSEPDTADPFNPIKLTIALAKMQSNAKSALSPDLARRREPTESYPLDALTMVGVLKKGGVTYAILQVEKTVFKVKAGNYVGQNFGIITAVTDSGMDITEKVQDASDEWVERKTSLELQETKK